MLRDFVSRVSLVTLMSSETTQIRRSFFQRSNAYFIISLASACAQVILRTALLVTDDNGARRKGVGAYPAPSNASQSLYRLSSDGGLEGCPDVPSTECRKLDLQNIGQEDLVCPAIASFASTLYVPFPRK